MKILASIAEALASGLSISYVTLQTPFLNLKNVNDFGIVGGTSLTIKHHSTIDNQEIELGYGISTSILPSRMGAVEDFLAVYSWVHQVCGDSPVFVWGHSLGKYDLFMCELDLD
ncbi:unnamed protein product [Diatraea saccharalis]|uniref:Uncharacterized protein n=1 Tax=Diatraea saccharalis TaxID=40085 RepID=A0A9N9WET8_9NEOP|nr:unnamed protein product [Diatraea saccharalis]